MSFDETLDTFKNAGLEACAPQIAVDDSRERLNGIINKLARMPGGIAIIETMLEHKIPLLFSKDIGIACYSYRLMTSPTGFQAMDGSKMMTINPGYDDAFLLGAIVHEARHLQQDAAGVLQLKGHASPADMIWYNRMIEADAQSALVMAAFEMKLAGDNRMFDTCKGEYTWMFDAIEQEYESDPTSLNDGRLRRMVFDTWFEPDAKAVYAHNIISDTYPRMKQQIDAMEGTAMQITRVTARDIEKIAVCGGEDINYLTLPGFRPLDDAFYRADHPIPGMAVKIDEMQQSWQEEYATQPSRPSQFVPGR